ncbi:MAG: transglutaminase-like domain-containing protein [Sediminibacterium sp.]|jgi:regulator of sirC expression with transglutaminase-like and TPR domain|nr:transglutaminase-like domain-containing protein [Sediminibacterium sp.]
MQKEAEISALFKLIDDPDEEVFNTIADRLLNYGTPIIPDLEHLWENTLDEATLERIEIMIYKLRLQDLKEAFIEWKSKPDPSLFEGALLVTKFQFPELAIDSLRHQMEKIRRNIWLELNNYLTPLEQANVIRNILFSYYQIKGVEVNYEKPEEFLISAPLQSKKGNAIANTLLYAELCQQLEIQAQFINIPKQCIIAFYASDWDPEEIVPNPQEFIQFYVEGTTGNAFSQKDLDQYMIRSNIEPKNSYYKALSNVKIIKKHLLEFAKCFNSPTLQYKQKDLTDLASLLD